MAFLTVRDSALPDPFVPTARASEAIIAGVEITRRRLRFDPPFYASWDTKPRTFWDAAIVAVHTDLGATGYGSGDYDAGFIRHDHIVRPARNGL